jgi:hypothetical protein
MIPIASIRRSQRSGNFGHTPVAGLLVQRFPRSNAEKHPARVEKAQ